MNKISIVIIAGNEEKVIVDCLKSCAWANEVILVAANSSDSTKKLAKTTLPSIKMFETNDEYNKNFSKWRNLGYKNTKNDWILYIDADERITDKLKNEIIEVTNSDSNFSYYVLPRANFYLGKRVRHGGSYPDYVKRLFLKKDFKGFTGVLHEEPIVQGTLGYLKNDLLHYTHRDLFSMINKTIVWTDMEAQALFNSGHPPVVWWRIIRMMLTKLYERLIKQQMWRDGTVGWISAIFESFDTFIIYSRLWELQQHA
ncbi:MAG: glycosyltransferase family 2 protein [Patescibacteria group bacterium]